MIKASRRAIVVPLILAASAFAAGSAHADGTSAVPTSYSENDKCMFRQWCQDGGLLTGCNMSDPLQGGCITYHLIRDSLMRFSLPVFGLLVFAMPIASTSAQDEEPCAGECGGQPGEGCEVREGPEISRVVTESVSYCTSKGQHTSSRFCTIMQVPVSIVCFDENGQITSQSARFKQISRTCDGWSPPIP